MSGTATQERFILNLRRRRVDSLCGAILTELQEDDRFPNEFLDRAHEALAQVFIRNGAYIMTDRDRDEMGLEPRDFLGWTPSERVERKRLEREAMLQMMNVTILTPK